ncbi:MULTISPECIES: type IX secretion system protein PorD [Tenacibaculum]|uniref:type IX secretion system protein PorD n=1 Tax=Tenacibaculum TaxID=104267 RepID=UPI001F0AFC42|nr:MULTISPECIES: DUF4835 family protein [Tenacibaculum]MCH3882548.1 DUF4835 family protein [Tenacibaculum aquimarinum]MCH3885637.1 DUF4835 family protein [Tenacibaculum aquimarinum]MDO6599966.1 DUF4835 family protein [Tenacibaculum sp. 1_MG-2023]
MRNIVLVLTCFLSITIANSQELNALVTVNADQVQSTNKQVYSTLETALTEFINQTEWTNKTVKPQERINCAFTIIVSNQSGNNFDASIQVQSTRPVFGSTYETPVLNINDGNFSFRYNEFDPLLFNATQFDSNLVSTIVFYVYTILGVDADTFALKGGQSYLKEAERVMLQAQQSGISGWQNQVGSQNRFELIDNFLSPKYATLRSIYYNFHRNGLDKFSSDLTNGKQQIELSVTQLEKLFNKDVGNYMIRVFLDAKSDEIVTVFTDGKESRNQQKMATVLQKIMPTQGNKWRKIE